MTYYAVIDTNVLVSALLTSNDNAATVIIVNKLFTGEIIPIYSNKILNEYIEVLNRKKFNFSKPLINYFIDAIKQFGILLNPSPKNILLNDMKDVPFYEIVLERTDLTYLITGNIKHFPKEKFVLTPR